MSPKDEKKFQFLHIEVPLEEGVHSVMLPSEWQWKRLKPHQNSVFFFGLDRLDSSPRTKEYKYEIVKAGGAISENMNQCYIDSVVDGNNQVWHLFEA